ncbi:type-2 histone deacetylase 1 [Musca vetustissima]|uniref:type-2 histone deacetylase 1 n=1 Tax=Musca vetustissima TaxID=27455 RepID=UPI002AB79FB4|nr:type-2 histone deacetylase 1 [Musca vetustissima]
MATFTQDEIDFLKAHGNDFCAKTWLGLWDPKRAVHQDQRELMIDKYERKRYYLEPASPLKSLTNATNLKTSSSGATTAATSTSTSSSSATSNNNRSNSNNNNSTHNNNHHSHIQLTPPTSQRTTANGLHKSSSSAISRPQHSGNSSSSNNNNTSHLQNGFNTDAFGLHNGLNLSVGSASTGALSDTSSCASANGFGAEADFVADFGSADIFNATVASTSPASSVGSASITNNGYAKIQQPLKASSTQGGSTAISAQQQFMNGFTSSNGGNNENFADFDHAPIYNAAGLPMSNGITINNKNSNTNGFNNNNNNNSNVSTSPAAPAADRYAALKDLDEQLRESKAVAAQAASIVTANVVESGFGNPTNGTVNPFAAHSSNPAVVANPFQNNGNAPPPNATQLFGQMTLIPNGMANGFMNAGQKSQANAGFFNYTANGFATTNNINNNNSNNNASSMNPAVAITSPAGGVPVATSMYSAGIPNGCGFGFGTMHQQQQIAATGAGLTANAFNNPFAASGALNSNNPFL